MASAIANASGQARFISQEELDSSEAVWIRLVRTRYLDPLSVERDWESAERKTRPQGSPIDGVGIVAILHKAEGPDILLQKQYRPPVGKVMIEIPAGLIDEGESPQECAVRELKEETGFVGVADDKLSTVMYNGKYFSDISSGFCL